MQSVLVTMDRHEWYASPQIYTRDDSSGIWIGKQALPPNCKLISSSDIKQEIEHVNQPVGEQLSNGVSSMDTGSSSEHVTGENVIADLNGHISSGDTDLDTSADTGNASVAERVIEPTLVMFEVTLISTFIIYMKGCVYNFKCGHNRIFLGVDMSGLCAIIMYA